jgi:hypothetical protein
MVIAWYEVYVRSLDFVRLKKGRHAENSTMDLADIKPRTFIQFLTHRSSGLFISDK